MPGDGAGSAIDELTLAAKVPGSASVRTRVLGSRRVVWFELADTGRVAPLTAEMAMVMEEAVRTAFDERLPIVLVVRSAGADIAQGIAPLHGWGRVARAMTRCSGVVPILAVLDGPAVSGPALLLGLTDLVVATDRSYAFVNGPHAVQEFTGVAIAKDELGSADTLARRAGLVATTAADASSAEEAIVDLLAHLPDHVDAAAPRRVVADPDDRPCPEAGELLPDSATGSYDVRAVAEAIVDEGSLLEVRDRWAGNMVTAFASIGGRSLGIVANQPMHLAGTLDIPASQKAARFVALCDSFDLPILTLVDTPGFHPGKDLEWRGMIRHGAQLVYAYGRATVPRVCVILRKSYGGAYIVMDSKTMGNDVCLAWPGAELAVMGAGQAAAVLRRGASDEERAAFEADYADRLLNPYVAAERGYVDAVVDPGDTRREVAAALAMLAGKRERLAARRHGNTPL